MLYYFMPTAILNTCFVCGDPTAYHVKGQAQHRRLCGAFCIFICPPCFEALDPDGPSLEAEIVRQLVVRTADV